MEQLKFRYLWNNKMYYIEGNLGLGFSKFEKRAKTSRITQWMGLKDKNKKDIYEGDIISYGEKKDGIILRIIFEDLYDCGYEIVRQKNKDVIHDIRMYRFDDVAKIMGNIFENPELLKGGGA